MRRLIVSTFFLLLVSSSTFALGDGSTSTKGVNERIIRALFEAFDRHDVEAHSRLYAADAYLMSSDFSAPSLTG